MEFGFWLGLESVKPKVFGIMTRNKLNNGLKASFRSQNVFWLGLESVIPEGFGIMTLNELKNGLKASFRSQDG